jgi:predicted AlkP superfamily pyrophosphatase or phosphodiesterase
MASQRVFMVSVDGMRPDGIAEAETPTLDRLIREGAYTPVARTVMPSVTLPCHTSMLRGVEPSRHGINTNTFHPLARPVPSLLDAAKQGDKKTGFFYNWEELRDLASPGSLDVSMMFFDCYCPEGDRIVAEATVQALERYDFDLVFMYLGWTDACGHDEGWMSAPYLEAISNADRCIGEVLAAYDRLGRSESLTTLVLSDHGGHGRSHGTEMEEDMRIPWLLHGHGVKRGHAITGDVNIYDTCVTLAHVLGLKPSPAWDGKVIEEALGG